MRKFFYLILLSALGLVSCGGKGETVVPVTGVTIDPPAVTLHLDGTVQLKASVLPENATSAEVSWSSANPIIAAVSAEGLVTAVSFGETTVRATCGEVSGTCLVKVVPVEVESVTVTPATLTLTEGETGTLSAEVLPADATDLSVVWSSSSPEVAAVDGGLVTAVAAGEAVISATASNGKSGSCTVRVKAPFSFSVEKQDRKGAWADASEGLAGYPGERIPVRLQIIEGEGVTFTWTVTGAAATYSEETVSLVEPGEAVLKVEASTGLSVEIPVVSTWPETFVFGSNSYAYGSVIPVGNRAYGLLSLRSGDDPIPTDLYSVTADDPALVQVETAESGYSLQALGTPGETILRIRSGAWLDATLCTIRIGGKFPSVTEPLEGEEDFSW
jgi:hypothetical protein